MYIADNKHKQVVDLDCSLKIRYAKLDSIFEFLLYLSLMVVLLPLLCNCTF